MNKSLKIIDDEVMMLAMKSYDVTNCRDGTMGQIQAICDLYERKDLLKSFCDAVCTALYKLSAKHRVLLVAVYVKNVDKNALAKKYKVSLSTVYRKLFAARIQFKNALEVLGYTEQWFNENFDGFDWINRRTQRC